jgi:hypothetical protein
MSILTAKHASKMPKIPKDQKRPTMIGDDGKDPAAKSLGQRGGRARAAALTKNQRVEIARKAAATRWRKR